MGAEVTVFLVEDRQLQGVDHAAHGVDDATRQKPSEGLARKGRDDLSKGEHADPAHGNVDQGRKPLGAGNPQRVDEDAHGGNAPYQCQKEPAGAVAQNQHADRRVGPGDQDKDHHMICLAQHTVDLR